MCEKDHLADMSQMSLMLSCNIRPRPCPCKFNACGRGKGQISLPVVCRRKSASFALSRAEIFCATSVKGEATACCHRCARAAARSKKSQSWLRHACFKELYRLRTVRVSCDVLGLASVETASLELSVLDMPKLRRQTVFRIRSALLRRSMQA